jgi:hypothetical protein
MPLRDSKIEARREKTIPSLRFPGQSKREFGRPPWMAGMHANTSTPQVHASTTRLR